MTDTRSLPSVAERTRAVAAGAPVVGAHFLNETAAFVLGEEALLIAAGEGEPRRVVVHDGAILASAADGRRVVTGGDDGKVMATAADGATTLIATDAKHRWVDRVAIGPDGAVAFSAGKQAFVRTAKGDERAVEVASTVGGLAFAPKGFRLAIAHYDGATLWFPNTQAKPEVLAWKGSHLGVRFSPDGKFLITSMQEPTLHGWRLADGRHMRMSGYGARVRSFDWTADGDFLATSGSNQLILWPFQGKDGPMGKRPTMLAPRDVQVERVACHPGEPAVAVGYADGMIVLVRLGDGAELLARGPGGAPVTALAWSASGDMLAFGSEDGDAGIVDLG